MDIVHFRPCEPDKCTKYVKLFTNHMPYPHPEKRLPGASLKKCKPDAAQPFPPIRRRIAVFSYRNRKKTCIRLDTGFEIWSR